MAGGAAPGWDLLVAEGVEHAACHLQELAGCHVVQVLRWRQISAGGQEDICAQCCRPVAMLLGSCRAVSLHAIKRAATGAPPLKRAHVPDH